MKIQKSKSRNPNIIFPEGATKLGHWIDDKGIDQYNDLSKLSPTIEENWSNRAREPINTVDAKQRGTFITYSINKKTHEKRIAFTLDKEGRSFKLKNFLEIDAINFFASEKPKQSTSYTKNKETVTNILKQNYAIAVIEILLKEGEITIKSFVEKFNVKEGMAKVHLKKLKDAGLFITLRLTKGKVLYKSALKTKQLIKIMNIFRNQ